MYQSFKTCYNSLKRQKMNWNKFLTKKKYKYNMWYNKTCLLNTVFNKLKFKKEAHIRYKEVVWEVVLVCSEATNEVWPLKLI